jgi:uncharacterized repeat protein (TIGR01451 family)
VFVIVNIPVGQADGDTAGVILTAVTAEAGTVGGTVGADLVETPGADTPGAVDIVFGDTNAGGNTARDGRAFDDDEFDVTTATITVLKTSRVISDPFNLTTNPKAIPGAVLEYCVQVANSGSVAASTVAVGDPLPAMTTYVAGTLFAGGTVTGSVCDVAGAAGGTLEDDDSDDAAELDGRRANVTGGTVTTTLDSVAPGTTVTTRFRVTVN